MKTKYFEISLFIFDSVKDHYEPKKTVSAFNNTYIEYESIADKEKTLTIKEYLDMFRAYFRDIINDHKIQGEWKINLTILINFVSTKDSGETRTMQTTNDNIEIMRSSETEEIIK